MVTLCLCRGIKLTILIYVMKNNSQCYKNGEINISPSMLMKILADARIGIVSLMFIDKGWDFEVYLLNGNTIVRVPRKPAVVARLRDEICILELIYHIQIII